MQPVVTAQLRLRRPRLFIHVFLAQRGVSGGGQRQPQRQQHQAQHSSAPGQLCNQLAPPRAGSPIVAADAETLSMRPGADSMTATLAAPTPPPRPQMPPPAPLPILPDDGGFACSDAGLQRCCAMHADRLSGKPRHSPHAAAMVALGIVT